MINPEIVLIFISILLLIIVEICVVARTIDTTNIKKPRGILDAIFPWMKINKKIKLLGMFGFLHGINHSILTIGYFYSFGLVFNNFNNFGLILLLSMIVFLIWLILPILEAPQIYEKLLNTEMDIKSIRFHFFITPICVIFIGCSVFLAVTYDDYLTNLFSESLFLFVWVIPPIIYLKNLSKEIERVKKLDIQTKDK